MVLRLLSYFLQDPPIGKIFRRKFSIRVIKNPRNRRNRRNSTQQI